MKIHVTPTMKGKSKRWEFAILGGNNKPVARSCGTYANRRNALEAAKAIADKKLKIEVAE